MYQFTIFFSFHHIEILLELSLKTETGIYLFFQ